jgi:PadR family transcriptional regulator, regulatory protein PadR
MNIQFKKGVLELCALALLTKKNRYGYQLVNEISKNVLISEGTIYPLLRRLKNEGYVTTYLEESAGGAPRKYYKLSEKGRSMAEELEKDWYDFVEKVNNLLEGKSNDSNDIIINNSGNEESKDGGKDE